MEHEFKFGDFVQINDPKSFYHCCYGHVMDYFVDNDNVVTPRTYIVKLEIGGRELHCTPSELRKV